MGEGDVDIVAVGDSFTMGYCVASEANFVARIRSVNKKTLNLGWAGTNSVFHFAVIKEFLGDLRPKNVLWVYYEGDDLDHITDTSNLSLTLT